MARISRTLESCSAHAGVYRYLMPVSHYRGDPLRISWGSPEDFLGIPLELERKL